MRLVGGESSFYLIRALDKVFQARIVLDVDVVKLDSTKPWARTLQEMLDLFDRNVDDDNLVGGFVNELLAEMGSNEAASIDYADR